MPGALGNLLRLGCEARRGNGTGSNERHRTLSTPPMPALSHPRASGGRKVGPGSTVAKSRESRPWDDPVLVMCWAIRTGVILDRG
jgi:hypothetical protein